MNFIYTFRGAQTYEDTRTDPDQVFVKLEQRQYFFTKKCCLIDINHFILKAEITIDRLKLIRSSMEMIFGVIIESFKTQGALLLSFTSKVRYHVR